MFNLMIVGGSIFALFSLVMFFMARGAGPMAYTITLFSMFIGIAVAGLGNYLSYR